MAEDLSCVDFNQFYGIEIGEFPARIAETPLRMFGHIMNNRLSLELGWNLAPIPIEKSPHIVHPMHWNRTGTTCFRLEVVLLCWAIRRSRARSTRWTRNAHRCLGSRRSARAAECLISLVSRVRFSGNSTSQGPRPHYCRIKRVRIVVSGAGPTFGLES